MHKITDFFTSIELIPSGRLGQWIRRPGFQIKKLAILLWLVMGTFLTLGYKSTLLSSLIPIQYEATIDSLNDLDKSGLPTLLAEGGSALDFFRGDPREMVTRIYNRRIEFLMEGGVPQWAWDM